MRISFSLSFLLGLAIAVGAGISLGLAFGVSGSDSIQILSALLSIGAVAISASLLFSSIMLSRKATRLARDVSRAATERVESAASIEDDSTLGDMPAYARLVRDIAKIEQHASGLLEGTGRDSSRRGFLALRADLYTLGFWADDDVRRFDEALRVRNAIVHGDFREVSDDKILSAIKATSELLAKLRAIKT